MRHSDRPELKQRALSATWLEGNAHAKALTRTLRKLDGSAVHEERVRPVGGMRERAQWGQSHTSDNWPRPFGLAAWDAASVSTLSIVWIR